MFLKFCKAAVRVWLAGKFYVTRFFIKRTVFLSRSFRCGSHAFEATKQQARDAQMGLHNWNTFRNITLTNSNKFIHIVTRRHNITLQNNNGVYRNTWSKLNFCELGWNRTGILHLKDTVQGCLYISLKLTNCKYCKARAYARAGGGLGLKSPPWAWYFTKTILPLQGD